ncbi:MAG: RNA 2',3'-cyclic phosphodiesterase [Marmoricola sp.]
MRMFVAVRPPEAVVEDLDEFLSVRRDAGAFRWTRSDQIHCTLAFLAAVPDHRLDDLVERVAHAARRRTAFGTAIAGGGAFPDPARGRVLWAGLDLTAEAATEIDGLAAGCRAAATRSGLEVDGQRFRPHLTVARIGRPTELSNWVRLLDTYRGPRWPVDEIALVGSHLGEGPGRRPRYEVVATFGLGAGSACGPPTAR